MNKTEFLKYSDIIINNFDFFSSEDKNSLAIIFQAIQDNGVLTEAEVDTLDSLFNPLRDLIISSASEYINSQL